MTPLVPFRCASLHGHGNVPLTPIKISALIDIHYSLHKAAVGKKMPAGQEGSYIVVLNTHDDAFRETADVDPEVGSASF
jgi:hypothetical protein